MQLAVSNRPRHFPKPFHRFKSRRAAKFPFVGLRKNCHYRTYVLLFVSMEPLLFYTSQRNTRENLSLQAACCLSFHPHSWRDIVSPEMSFAHQSPHGERNFLPSPAQLDSYPMEKRSFSQDELCSSITLSSAEKQSFSQDELCSSSVRSRTRNESFSQDELRSSNAP
jgi:hypothetical protein